MVVIKLDKGILLAPMDKSIAYQQLIDNIRKEKTPLALFGLGETQKAHIGYGINRDLNRQVYIISHNETEARQIYEDLKFYAGDQVAYFPAKEILFYNVEAVQDKIEEERIRTIEKIIGDETCIIVSSIEALVQQLLPPDHYRQNQISFKLGQEKPLAEVIETLSLLNYERLDMVEERGQFSIRGDIIDIFPTSSETPYRVELFGDQVDSIRQFDINSQRSLDKIDSIKIYSAKEATIKNLDLEEIGLKLERDYEAIRKKLGKEEGEKLREELEATMEKLREEGNFKGIEKFMPYIYQKPSSLLDYLSQDAIILLDDPGYISDKARAYTEEFQDNFNLLMERGQVFPGQRGLIIDYGTIVDQLKNHRLVNLSLLPKSIKDFKTREIVNFQTRPVQTFNGKIDLLIKEIKALQYRGYKIVLVPGSKERALRLLETLREEEVNGEFPVRPREDLLTGQLIIVQGNLRKGFEYIKDKYILITDFEIYGVHKQQRRPSRRKDASPIKSFVDLNIGDYVVHEGHGIGKYVGIEELTIDNIKKDYLKIAYLGQDFLYVPTDQMDLIQKYIGSENVSVKLNRLGSPEWAKTKTRVRKAIEDMAEDLLKLYAAREKTKGFAFGKDTDWQKQFEDLFPYVETPDQLKCIQEVKEDMEKPKIMDRLLCGDVGYGKTEVGIRAAFKAVVDNKQVAVLVPTTILAQQHYNTFKERFTNFPVNIEVISRFKTPRQQKQIIEDLRTGNVDIIIGTHRLLSKDVTFKDLGLLIVDEEQRFGVKNKEALKQLKKSVDVLTMTATPIPRTLHMSMIGIRDISIIEEPPEERFPVQTYVLGYNEALVIDAISREVARGGQVYYVYNRVHNIEKVAGKIARLLPDSRVAVAHGQMSERDLERIMVNYMEGKYDILVSTTIIENGLDISNVNTIIIQDADKLGLSQLYQLRGRVGRSHRQGYAYLMYQEDKILSQLAEKRLKTIKEFTEFGSGFKIAMRDLEIRGAGNILGGEQHGHMAAIGYDLYIKLLEETVGRLRGQYVEKFEDTTIEINVDAYISDKYISNQGHKIEIYKKIASIRGLDDMYAVEEEMEDRFGDIPLSARNLLLISYIKAMARQLKIGSISQRDKEIRIQFEDDSQLRPEVIGSLLHKYNRKLTFNGTCQPYFIYRVLIMDQYKMLTELKNILEEMAGQ